MEGERFSGRKLPQTWEEMEALHGQPLDEHFQYVLPTRRYAFITNDVRIGGSRILLMMRSPFRDVRLYQAWYGSIAHGLRERGRWVILQDTRPDTEPIIRARHVLEETIVQAFAQAAVPLPPPDGLGEWPHEAKCRQTRNNTILLVSIVFGPLIIALLAMVIKHTHKRSQSTIPTSTEG